MGKCDKSRECRTDHCKICTINQSGAEMCSMCDNGYALMLSGTSSKCVVLNSDTQNCLYLDSRYTAQ